MIGHIRGKLQGQWDRGVVMDVKGVGFEIQMPASTLADLPPSGHELTVFTHLVCKDDAMSLFGFDCLEARDMFRLLIEVSGVGPRLALNILSAISAEELLLILAREEAKTLQTIHGVGKKTAARLCVDLREKAKDILARRQMDVEPTRSAELLSAENLWDEAFSALTNLGYRSSETRAALSRAVASAGEGADLEDLVKKALQCLAKSRIK